MSAAVREPERIEHRMWWCDGEKWPGHVVVTPHWVPFQTYRWAPHGCWTVETRPWIIVEIRP